MMNDSGLLLLNLGSPDSYSIPDVRRYLGEFLMDERVIDAPYLVRSMIVKGFILPFRPGRSAHAYSKVWTTEGSPLKVITESFKKEIEQLVELPVSVAMRYGNPTPQGAFDDLRKKCSDLKRVFIAPMYPHYAMSSYETAVVHARKSIPGNIDVQVLKPFYKEADYIDCLAASIQPHVEVPFDHVLFSYHGLPVRHLKKSDCTHSHCYAVNNCCNVPSKAWDTCYKHQVTQTTNLVASKLGLLTSQFTVSFQSRLGRDEWTRPFTSELLESFPSMGVKKLVIVCPAFVADCLETLEEIGITGKEAFMKAGGESMTVVPCLNTFTPWVKTFTSWCNDREHNSLWKK
jgi:ferrochelatase